MRFIVAVSFIIAAMVLSSATVRADEVSAVVTQPAYEVRATRVKAGRLRIVVATKGGFHLNDDYPLHFTPAAANDVAWTKARIEKADGIELEPCTGEAAHACRATAAVGYSLVRPARAVRIGGTLAFSACDADRCLIEKVAVSVTVEN